MSKKLKAKISELERSNAKEHGRTGSCFLQAWVDKMISPHPDHLRYCCGGGYFSTLRFPVNNCQSVLIPCLKLKM